MKRFHSSGLADQITVKFSENTNMGGFFQGQILSPLVVRQIFDFSLSLGDAFSGSFTYIFMCMYVMCVCVL